MLRDKVLERMQKRGSQLCIGLDPPVSMSASDKVEYCREVIEQTHKFAVAYKPNRQFLLGMRVEEMQEITGMARSHGCLTIMDHKLSDIGNTNRAALETIKREGFDMLTVSPFPGNVKETCEVAHELGLGVILLTLMSNPEAEWMLGGVFLEWAEQAEQHADGMVIGTTNHVRKRDLEAIAGVAPGPIVLAPGIGAQGGSVEEVLTVFADRVMFNVSRGILLADDRNAAAERYHMMIEEAREALTPR